MAGSGSTEESKETATTNLQRQQQELAKQKELTESESNCYRMWWDQVSLYSNKMRTYFNYKKIPYKFMQNTFASAMGEIPELVGMQIMPVVLTPDNKVMQDSTPMMEWFEQEYPERAAIPEDDRLAWIMWLLEEFSDEGLPRPAMRTRWGTEESSQSLSHQIARGMGYGSSADEVKAVARMINDRQSGFDKVLALNTDEEKESVDKQLAELLAILEKHFHTYSYLLGDRPSLTDFAFYGPLGAHMFKDPVSRMMLETTAPMVCRWLDELDQLGDTRGGLGREAFGDWLSVDDGIPETLLALIGFIARTFLPISFGYVDAMLKCEKFFKVTVDGVESSFKRMDYRAGTFAILQRRYIDLPDETKLWLSDVLAETGILPGLITRGVYPNPAFEKLTPPFITDPEANRIAYKGK